METKIKGNINIPEEIQSLIKERINKECPLFQWEWDPTILSLFSQTRFAYDPDYITIHFKHRANYFTIDRVFLRAKESLTEIFLDALTWFEITDNSTDEFWIIIRDVTHQKSWARIK